MTQAPDVLRRTARDLLIAVAGNDHALHTVVQRTHPYRGLLSIVCSCGTTFETVATRENTDALRNVQVMQ